MAQPSASPIALPTFSSKVELRESKDEILCGELIRGLTAHGWTCRRITAHSDRQQMSFVIPDDDVLCAAHVVVDRRSGSGAVTSALGSKTILGFAAEIDNGVTAPAELSTRWQEDLPNLFRLPVAGEVRISHQPGSVMARTFHMVDLDQYVQGSNVGTGALVDWAKEQVDQLREALRPLKK